ncbi:hypothetical protein ACWOAH_04640 [Vagococcus vulneris]|uniref:Competence protein ComG n=1 Tax=Vagococcus vulneris TaxID=1977869 RepID=A0A430A071_9ENTE|nr:hypothetical protein [Vagococcus vulneris]RST99736.1 hypothetical protein CBF37_03145 [Vagococcus vulneris]
MKKKRIRFTCIQNNHQGGIFLGMLLLLILLSTLYLFLIEGSIARQKFYRDMENYYQAMCLIALAEQRAEVQQDKLVQKSAVVYNIGKIEMKQLDTEGIVQITATLNNDFVIMKKIRINSQE